jgi:hypothetical protein
VPDVNAFTDEEKRVLKGLAEVLEQFLLKRANIPLHQVTLLLRLAIDEGHSQKQYSDTLGFPPSTVSRAMLDLGKRRRSGDEGLGLWRSESPPTLSVSTRCS